MAALLYTFLGMLAAGSVVTLYAALTAKEGYEDETGFHTVLPESEANSQAIARAATVRR
ncbi:MAG: hypothetical protein JNL39_18480 [Opitutaceae bacterium]|nr:hypothetical protein [Opitutaceae bacterium]